MAEIQYQRLTRARTRSGLGLVVPLRSSLWLSADHLLRLDSSGFTETYKRFYYRDIQAMIVRQTNHWKTLGLLCVAIAGIITLLAILARVGGSAIAAWIYGVLATCFVLVAIVTLAGGPSCTCQIRTAVQTEDLPPLNTVRRAQKALDRLRPLIVAAQGELAREEIPARLQAWRRTGAPASLPIASPPPDSSLPPLIAPDA